MLSPRRRPLQQATRRVDEVEDETALPPKEDGIELQRIDSQRLPTWEESEFEIVLRRQRSRLASPAKVLSTPSRFSTPQLDNLIDFSGWGSTSHLAVTERDLQQARDRLQAERAKHIELGHLAAASIPAMGVLGSVFYSLPAVVAVCGMLSPISLLIATLLLIFIRPILEELASALPINGSCYAYLLNTTSKSFAMVAAALQLIDYVMNALQAAATASAYVGGEATLPFPVWVLAAVLLIAFALIGCLGAKESASLTLTVAAFHMLTMAALMIMSLVAWAKRGNQVISANWHANLDGVSSDFIARRCFNGICLGLLAISGFECSPEYAPACRPGRYPQMLRNLHWSAVLLIAPIMLFVLALLPIEEVLAGYNVLSLLAESVSGRWFRRWLLADAMIVLCGGILTGGLSACSLVYRLAQDGMLPPFFLRKLPFTHAPWAIQAVFTLLCLAIYASTSASVQTIGRIFSISLLCVLALFPISALLLKFNRGRLPRERSVSLALVLFCLALLVVALAGNIAIDPSTLTVFVPYCVAFAAVLVISEHSLGFLRVAYWAYDSSDIWRRGRWTKGIGPRVISWMRRLRRQPVACFVKTDEINTLIRFVLYVQQNEPTAHLKLVHIFESTEKVPEDFEAFSQILDEAFPNITIDMCFVHGAFDALTINAVCEKLRVPRSSAFIASFSQPSITSLLKESVFESQQRTLACLPCKGSLYGDVCPLNRHKGQMAAILRTTMWNAPQRVLQTMQQAKELMPAHAASLAAVLQACCFEELTPDVVKRLKSTVDSFAYLHQTLSPIERNEALRTDPCLVWSCYVHAESLVAPSLPMKLIPSTVLPALEQRLPTRQEWHAPGPYPPQNGPVPGSHAAVLRYLMNRPTELDDAYMQSSEGSPPSISEDMARQSAIVWQEWRRMAGFFLQVISDFFPDAQESRQKMAPMHRVEQLRRESAGSSLPQRSQWRRASEPATLRPSMSQIAGLISEDEITK